MVVLDISDPAKPKRIDGGYDYSPPFNGDPKLPREGCCPGAHTLMPAHHLSEQATIAVLTDEHFTCPPGFGRILDVTNLDSITLLSTYHISVSTISTIMRKKRFVCPEGSQESAHMAEFDHRVKAATFFTKLGTIRDCGRSISRIRSALARSAFTFRRTFLLTYQPEGPPHPRALSGLGFRCHIRNRWQRRGLTALRYTGPMPTKPPIPGLR